MAKRVLKRRHQSHQDTKDLGSTAISGGQNPVNHHAAETAEMTRHLSVVRLDEKLTIDQFCKDLGIARSTFYDWRAKGRAPRCIVLPNRELRIRRSEYERWLDSREEAA